MCGIFGYILPNSEPKELEILNGKLVQSLRHRGPDDHGIYQCNHYAIANTRLSIIDIAGGHQPMHNDDGSVYVVQNGEIYNYIELKEELMSLGHVFQSTSDTEVLIEAYLEWGKSFVEKLNGMFAIAVVDHRIQELLLYRDRLGVKPLYLYQNKGDLMFSSEIKTFLRYDGFNSEINEQSICDYLILNYVPLPLTIFSHVRHLEPGHYIEISLNDPKTITTTQYWDVDKIKEDHNRSLEDFAVEIEGLLHNAVDIRLRSDVEVGAFLSGGLDSSMVTAIMRKVRSKDRITTYSIGFKEKEFDESEYAKAVVRQYDLENDMMILEGDIIEYWNRVTYHNDQPHGDISFIPTYILSEFTSKKLKVVLTGDGGDELFAGYLKYLELEKHEDIGQYFRSSSVFTEERLGKFLNPRFKERVDLTHAEKVFRDTLNKVDHKDLINKVLYYEMKQLLPGNNLVKPDKMAMANSLETRSPFMDYRLYELANHIPGKMKLKSGDTKHILKKIALSYFDHDHIYRRKQMFTVPVGEWFKNKLSGYLLEIIQSDSLKSRGIWDADLIGSMAKDHISGEANYTRELRAIVNLELWFRIFMDKNV